MTELAGGLASPSGDPTGPLPVATADHLILSLDQQLTPGVRLGIQGFLKGFSSIAGSTRSTSSGLDLRVLREGENLVGWLGYSLSWFWSDDQRPGVSTSEFTGRHLLSAGLAGRLAGPLGVDLRLSFSEGLPYTTVPLANSSGPSAERYALPADDLEAGTPVLGGGPTDGFLRIDVELYADLLPGWGGPPLLAPPLREAAQRARSSGRPLLVLRALARPGREAACRTLPPANRWPGVAVLS